MIGCNDVMDTSLLATAVANTTQEPPDGNSASPIDMNLRPALFSGYRELAGLRYDFPLVLGEDDGNGVWLKSLSEIVNGILQEIAPADMTGERLRKHVLGLENEIRILISGGAGGSLSDLWGEAEQNMLSRAGDAGAEDLRESFRLVRGALRAAGDVIDCDHGAADRMVAHARTTVEEQKARKFVGEINYLVLKLTEILKSDFMKSDEARDPEHLRRSVGAVFEAEFDFKEMSRILSKASSGNPLSEDRRQRIRAVLSILESQRFFPRPEAGAAKDADPKIRSFVFTSCDEALQAFQDRLPEMASLVKAISIARLEIENRYTEARHDTYFDSFDENSLTLEDMASFPTYFVRILEPQPDAAEQERLFRLLSSDLPIKVLRQTEDILDDLSASTVQFSAGGRDALVASMAVGLNSAFVVQAGTASLYRLKDRIVDALAFHGPALINVYSGSTTDVCDLPAYVISASAVESRAFPVFVYDPSAGPDWASRFCIDDNPQPHAAWPAHRLAYEDHELQTTYSDMEFTFVDFAACDGRMAKYLVRVPRSQWTEHMVPVGEYMQQDAEERSHNVPYILMTDEQDRLHRVVVDDKLIYEARHYGERWRSLQELGGIDNSHATRLLAQQREVWEEEKQQAIDEAVSHAAPVDRAPQPEAAPDEAPAAADATPVAEEAEEPVQEGPIEEACIETPRCTTCNECTDLNNRMFAYNENQQAYIKDPDAGSFKDLVVAAETCQVCIIHPGKPRNPDEPGLDELIARAAPFN